MGDRTPQSSLVPDSHKSRQVSGRRPESTASLRLEVVSGAFGVSRDLFLVRRDPDGGHVSPNLTSLCSMPPLFAARSPKVGSPPLRAVFCPPRLFGQPGAYNACILLLIAKSISLDGCPPNSRMIRPRACVETRPGRLITRKSIVRFLFVSARRSVHESPKPSHAPITRQKPASPVNLFSFVQEPRNALCQDSFTSVVIEVVRKKHSIFLMSQEQRGFSLFWPAIRGDRSGDPCRLDSQSTRAVMVHRA